MRSPSRRHGSALRPAGDAGSQRGCSQQRQEGLVAGDPRYRRVRGLVFDPEESLDMTEQKKQSTEAAVRELRRVQDERDILKKAPHRA